MKKFIFGFIGMMMSAMIMTSCGSGAATAQSDDVVADSVEMVDSVVADTLAVDTLVVDTVVAE